MSQVVAFPKVQTQSREVNQLQNNAIAAVQQVSSSIKKVSIIGEIKYSTLSLTQFQQQVGSDWVACNGASCVGSDYNILTGLLAVPNIAAVDGVNAFIRTNG